MSAGGAHLELVTVMDRAGAAGGTVAAAIAVLGARLVAGADMVLDLLDTDEVLRGADLILTGEGSLDVHSLGGKAPVAVARRARAHDVPVVAVAGRVDLDEEQVEAAGLHAVLAPVDLLADPTDASRDAVALVERAAAEGVRAVLLHRQDLSGTRGPS